MLCPSCGAEVGDSIRVCDNCTPKEPTAEDLGLHEEVNAEVMPADGEYAGFWIRFAALVIDGSIVGIPISFVNLLLTKAVVDPLASRVVSDVVNGKPAPSSMGFLIFGSMLAGLASAALICLLLSFAGWYYFAWFESSPSGATPGKKFCGLRVVDVNGERISFWRASKRYFSQVLSMLPLGGGYLYNLFNPRRQTLHDLISGCTVVRTHYPPTPKIVGTTIAVILLSLTLDHFVFDTEDKSMDAMFSSLDSQIARQETASQSPRVIIPPQQPPAALVPTEPELVPQPSIDPEKEMWALFPASPEGPHALIGLNGEVVSAKVVLGIAYPAGNSISLAFFPDKLTPEEIAEFQRRGTLTSAVNLKRAMLVLSIEFVRLSDNMHASDIAGYTATFYADASSAPFRGSFKAASLTRKRQNFLPDEVATVSGNGTRGGKLSFTFQSSGSAPAGGSNKVRWDLSGDAALFGAK